MQRKMVCLVLLAIVAVKLAAGGLMVPGVQPVERIPKINGRRVSCCRNPDYTVHDFPVSSLRRRHCAGHGAKGLAGTAPCDFA